MNARVRIMAVIGAIAVVVVAWLLVRAGDGRGARGVEPVRVGAAPVAPEPEPTSLPNQTRDSEPAPAERDAVPVAEPEPAKADKPTSVDEPTSTAALGPDEALLIVDVTSADTGKPLAEVRLQLYPAVFKSRFFMSRVQSSRAKLGQMPITTAHGRAEFVVPPGESFRLATDDDDVEAVSIEIAALAPGEERSVELRPRTEVDYVFHARIVDAETGASIATALVRSTRTNEHGSPIGEPTTIQADRDGRVALPTKSWEYVWLDASAPGYATRECRPSREHDSVARELLIGLRRAATLDCLVTKRGAAVAGATVRVSTKLYSTVHHDELRDMFDADAEWTGTTSADGHTRIAELPSGIELRVSVSAAESVAREDAAVVSLAAGEERSIEIALDARGAIAGVLLESSGKPIPTATVWLVADDGGVMGYLTRYPPPANETIADELGRFRFDDVAPGRWCVGAEPGSGIQTDPARVIAPLAECVDVAEREVRVELRTDVGLYIAGRVLGPDDDPLTGIPVWAFDPRGSVWLGAVSESGGRFRVGPLVAGTWRLAAGALAERRPDANWTDALAGSADVVLRAEEPASVKGRIVDADGADVDDAWITCARMADDPWSCQMAGADRGTFSFEVSGAGSYSIIARTGDGRFGALLDVRLAAGERREGLTLTVEPGALLALRNPGAELASFMASWNGAVIAFDGIEPEDERHVVVPPGELTLHVLWNEEKEPRTQTVTIARGETKEIVLERSQ